jgi:hypothetical protein
VFVFNRPLSAVAAGLGVALLILCLDRLSHALEAQQHILATLQEIAPGLERLN